MFEHARTVSDAARSALALSAVTILTAAAGDARAQQAMTRTPMPGVTVEIVELKRIENKAVGLVYKVTNGTDERLKFERLGAGEHAASVVALVDFKNGKRYGVGKAGGNCLCSAAELNLEPKTTKQYWAHFAAPPADVDKITVIIGSVPPFNGVPIQN